MKCKYTRQQFEINNKFVFACVIIFVLCTKCKKAIRLLVALPRFWARLMRDTTTPSSQTALDHTVDHKEINTQTRKHTHTHDMANTKCKAYQTKANGGSEKSKGKDKFIHT